MEPSSLIGQKSINQNIMNKRKISSVVRAKEEKLLGHLGGFRWSGAREVYSDKMKTELRFEWTRGGTCVCGVVLGWGEGDGQGHSSHLEECVQRACGGESMGIQLDGTERSPEWLGQGDGR